MSLGIAMHRRRWTELEQPSVYNIRPGRSIDDYGSIPTLSLCVLLVTESSHSRCYQSQIGSRPDRGPLHPSTATHHPPLTHCRNAGTFFCSSRSQSFPVGFPNYRGTTRVCPLIAGGRRQVTNIRQEHSDNLTHRRMTRLPPQDQVTRSCLFDQLDTAWGKAADQNCKKGATQVREAASNFALDQHILISRRHCFGTLGEPSLGSHTRTCIRPSRCNALSRPKISLRRT